METKSQLSQVKPGGNTKTPGPKYQMYCWFFTLPMEECSASQLSQQLKGFCKKFTFSGEKAPTTGYLHWQGCFSLKTKEYFQTVKNMFPNSIHLEPTKNVFAANNYCKKLETHVEGPYDENSVFLKLIEDLYPWQKKVRDLCLEEPDDRHVYWFWEPVGCKGKTQFCKYMAAKHGASILSNGAMKDIAFALSGFPTETGNPQVIARFLRGMAKLKEIESSVENARGEWMANNKGLLNRAKTGFTAGDFAVNAGPGRSAKILQTAVGVPADGGIGPVTLAAVKAQDPVELIQKFSDAKEDFYRSLNTFETFGKGWLNRVAAVKIKASSMLG